VQFVVKKNTKVLNINFVQNASVTKDTVKSQPNGFSWERDDACFHDVILHVVVVQGTPVLHGIKIWLQRKAVITKDNNNE
jgi:hypothetical protein